MILHFSQIGLTDDLTFTVKSSFQKKSDYNYIIAKINLQQLFSIIFLLIFFYIILLYTLHWLEPSLLFRVFASQLPRNLSGQAARERSASPLPRLLFGASALNAFASAQVARERSASPLPRLLFGASVGFSPLCSRFRSNCHEWSALSEQLPRDLFISPYDTSLRQIIW